MAGRDLRALFSTNDPRLEAGEAFTNRQMQWELVAAALTGHLQRTADPAFDVEDLEAPRDNVMVFHGVGGIGKTTLSRKLEAALAGGARRIRPLVPCDEGAGRGAFRTAGSGSSATPGGPGAR